MPEYVKKDWRYLMPEEWRRYRKFEKRRERLKKKKGLSWVEDWQVEDPTECAECGESLIGRRQGTIYCSVACRMRAYRRRKSG